MELQLHRSQVSEDWLLASAKRVLKGSEDFYPIIIDCPEVLHVEARSLEANPTYKLVVELFDSKAYLLDSKSKRHLKWIWVAALLLLLGLCALIFASSAGSWFFDDDSFPGKQIRIACMAIAFIGVFVFSLWMPNQLWRRALVKRSRCVLLCKCVSTPLFVLVVRKVMKAGKHADAKLAVWLAALASAPLLGLHTANEIVECSEEIFEHDE